MFRLTLVIILRVTICLDNILLLAYFIMQFSMYEIQCLHTEKRVSYQWGNSRFVLLSSYLVWILEFLQGLYSSFIQTVNAS